MRRPMPDLSTNPKSFTSFIKENYHTLINKTKNTEELIQFIDEGTKESNISNKYRDALYSKLRTGTVVQNQFHLTNAYLSGKGMSLKTL